MAQSTVAPSLSPLLHHAGSWCYEMQHRRRDPSACELTDLRLMMVATSEPRDAVGRNRESETDVGA